MQKDRWNNAWVELQSLMDQSLAPFVAPLLEGVSGMVLDVGCGTGATTLAAVQAGAQAVGVDLSEAMIEAARARTDEAEFIVADAQTHGFEPASFDWVISRFGVMFFAEPAAAFANLRDAGRNLRVIVWRSAEENPFHTAAEQATAPLLPNLTPRDPDGPGQFAFGDARKVRGILERAGWVDIELEPLDVECTLPESELETYFTRLGPVGIALQNSENVAREPVIEAVRAAFEPFVDGDTVRYTAACWLITASSE